MVCMDIPSTPLPHAPLINHIPPPPMEDSTLPRFSLGVMLANRLWNDGFMKLFVRVVMAASAMTWVKVVHLRKA